MLGLPEGWESDYDGKRWFYRYKPNGLTQWQFPKVGDEFPAFVGDNVELEPEERLQMRRKTSPGSDGDGVGTMSGMGEGVSKKPATTASENEFAMSATGYFDPSSFMHFGPDDLDDDAAGNELSAEEIRLENKGNEAGPDSASVSIQSPGPTPSSAKSEPVTVNSTEPISPPAELSADNQQKPSPVGLVPELAGPHTAKCAEELAPVELDAVSPNSIAGKPNQLRSEVAELSADSKPRERKPPPPRPPPPPMQPVDSYPLVSASFAYPPIRTTESPRASVTQGTKEAEVQRPTEVPRPRPMSVGDDQPKYQPFTLANRVVDDSRRDSLHSQRSSMVLSGTTVLQTQNSELGPLSRKPEPGPADQGLGKPGMFVPPTDPRVPKVSPPSGPPPRSSSASESVQRVLQVPPKMPLDAPSPPHSPEQPGRRPLPGSGARHESISSYPDQPIRDNRNPNIYYAPSILKPAHRRSNFSLPQSDQPTSPPTSPSRPVHAPEAPVSQRGPPKTHSMPIRHVANPPYPLDQVSLPYPRGQQSLPYPEGPEPHPIAAPVAPPPPRAPSLERGVSTYQQPAPSSHSRDSMPDPLDQIDDVLSELSNMMPQERDPQPAYATMPVPRGAGNYRASPPLSHGRFRHHSVPAPTTTPSASGIMPSPPSVSGSQTRHTPSFEVSLMHTPDMNEQRSPPSGPAARSSVSSPVFEMESHTATPEEARGPHYPIPGVVSAAQPQSAPKTTAHSVVPNIPNQGQMHPGTNPMHSVTVAGQVFNPSSQRDTTNSPPALPELSGSSSHAEVKAQAVSSQQTLPPQPPNIAQDSTKNYFRQHVDLSPPQAIGPPSPQPPPQSEVSSPTLSVTSLHRAVSTASSKVQVAGVSQAQPVSRTASVSGQQQVIHEVDATAAKASSPAPVQAPAQSPAQSPVSSTVPEASAQKAKPFPMLPGQVTPMPSQIGSEPIPLPVQPEVKEPTIQPSGPSSPTQVSQLPLPHHLPSQAQPALSQNPALAGSGPQYFSQAPPPQMQIMPNQHMVLLGQSIQYTPTGIIPNGTAVPSAKEKKGVKKWAKKIFNSSSSKQNVAGAGVPPVPQGPSSVQQLVMGVPQIVPMKAPIAPLQHQPPAPAPPPPPPHLPQFNSTAVQGPVPPNQPPVLAKPPPHSSMAMQGPTMPPQSHPPTIPVVFAPPPPGPSPNHVGHIPQTHPKPEPVVHTTAGGAVSGMNVTTPSTVTTAVTSPPVSHGLASSTVAHSAPVVNPPPSSSPTAPQAPTENGVPGPVDASNTQVPRSYVTNGAPGAVGSDPRPASPGGRWQTASVDYSGGDWGNGW